MWLLEFQKAHVFRTPFANKGVHGSLTTTNPGMRHFYPNFELILDKLSQRTSLLLRLEILGPFGNTFTGNHMNSSHNRDKFPRQVLTPLSPKSKTFHAIFLCNFEIYIEFCAFSEKDRLHSSNVFEVIKSKKCGYLNARKLLHKHTLRESISPRVRNNDKLWTPSLLSQFSINPRQIELENISFRQNR